MPRKNLTTTLTSLRARSDARSLIDSCLSTRSGCTKQEQVQIYHFNRFRKTKTQNIAETHGVRMTHGAAEAISRMRKASRF